MNKDSNKIFPGKPAPYPSTSTAELDSKAIFQSLIDPHFIKGELRAMDKVPNYDGILDIIDENQFPVGKIEVQLKTLSPRNYKSPSFSVDRDLFAYCEYTALPMILVAVNRRDKRAYWLHMDEETLRNAAAKITGKTFKLSLPLENCIDGQQRNYIEAWTQKAREVVLKVWNYNSLKQQKRNLEESLKELHLQMQVPINLPLPLVRVIHTFLDYYNYILDKEFASVKAILYPDFWKIGIGILKTDGVHLHFVLYPVEYKNSQVLVKVAKQEEYTDIGKDLFDGTIMLYVSTTIEELVNHYVSYCYRLLQDSILRVAGQYHFPIDDEGVAREYLTSFIDRHYAYLDMEKDAPAYSIKELKLRLYGLLPMHVATEHHFADWVQEHTHTIDSYHSWQPSAPHKKRLEESRKKIEAGFVSKVKVTIGSQVYNMELVNYYIQWLEKRGATNISRRYRTGQYDEHLYGVDFWKTWHKDVLWENVQSFFIAFHQLYEDYVARHFPYLQQYLKIRESKEITIVYLLLFDESKAHRPYLEVYHLWPSKKEEGKVLLYLAEDVNSPIDRKKFHQGSWECTIGSKLYTITLMHVQVLEFMFSPYPVYTLINENLKELLEKFFRECKNLTLKSL